jgi:hypothetical protein
MPKEFPVPDEMRQLIEKRGGNKDRRRKTQGRPSDDDESVVRRAGEKGRNQINIRDLLNYDDEDE